MLFIAFGIALYFLPSILAHHKRRFGSILALNLFLGWTFIGWIVALIWALQYEAPPPVVVQHVGMPGGYCCTCGSRLEPGRFCQACGKALA